MTSLLRLPLIQMLVLLALVAPVTPSGTTQLRSGSGSITEFDLRFNLFGLTAAPDGTIWFTEVVSNKYGWLTPSSTNPNKDAKTFDLPAGSIPVDITAGESGQLWLTEYGRNAIVRITPTNDITPTTTTFTLPTLNSAPFGITLGSDHNIWFTEFAGNKIGRITPTGDKIDEYAIPTPGSAPQHITQATDGNLWFTEAKGNKIGRITPDGVISEFPIPTPDSRPFDITMGPFQSLWFTEANASQIGKIRLDGQINFAQPTPTPNSVPKGIIIDNVGNLWYTEAKTSKIGLITPGGITPDYQITGSSDPDYLQSVPQAIVKGSNGDIWFTEYGTDVIGHFTPAVAPLIERVHLNGKAAIQSSTQDPNGNLWLTDAGRKSIGRITLGGQIAEFSIPSNSTPTVITGGPNDTIWFAEYKDDTPTRVYQIARLTTSDGQITEFSTFLDATTNQPVSLGEIRDMTAGPDNTIWFIEAKPDGNVQITYKIARLTTSDGHITEFPNATQQITLGSIEDIVVGPDNNIWFTESGNDATNQLVHKIARLTISDGHIDEFITPGSGPQDITTGSDGNLWFTEGNRIGRISATGQDIIEFPEYTSAINLGSVSDITAGHDGNLYFLEGNKIGRITPDGQVITEFPIPYSVDITIGPSGGIWFTTQSRGVIGRLLPWGSALPLVIR